MCTLIGDPLVASLQRGDLSQRDNRWKCVKVKEIEGYLSAGYWAYKTFQWLAGVP